MQKFVGTKPRNSLHFLEVLGYWKGYLDLKQTVLNDSLFAYIFWHYSVTKNNI